MTRFAIWCLCALCNDEESESETDLELEPVASDDDAAHVQCGCARLVPPQLELGGATR